MPYTTGTNPETAFGTEFAKMAFAPLRTMDVVLQSIVGANRLARELENLTHASDRKLRELGIAREDVAHYVARNSKEFRIL